MNHPQIEPKQLYRVLNRLVESIHPASDRGRAPQGFTEALFATIGELIPLTGMVIYAERRDGFELVRSAGHLPTPAAALIDRNEVWLANLQESRFEICTDPGMVNSPCERGIIPCGPSTALLAGFPSRQYLVFFLLAAGWVRENVELVLNTVRVALGSRLMRERVRATFAEAAEIQRSLLLDRPPQFADFDIAFRTVSAEEVGGDLYDFIEFDNEILGISIGDASGHGLPAALLVHDVVTGLRMGLERDLKVSYVFTKLNKVIHRSRLTSRFVSVFYGELEANGNLIYVNAGHIPPQLFLADRVEELRTGGTVIGPMPDVKFKRGFAHVDRGATLVMVTDGILERRNANDEEYGVERLRDLVRCNPKATSDQLLDLLFEEVSAFDSDGRWEDDATAVVIQRPLRKID